ncbi:DUF6056 family protein [Bacteroides caecigallinarum]|nr:DUF6056 family protein [Bacteroides caecigallinarum]
METKFISNNIENKKDILFYITVFILFYLQDRFSTFATDDYRYLVIGGMSGGIDGVNNPVQSFKDIIISQIYDYNHINGRFIVHCITTLFCCFINIDIFRIVNSILFIVLISNIDKILKFEGYNSPYNKYIVTFCLFFVLPVPGEVLVGHIATCVNYLWVACATTYFIILIHKSKNTVYRWYMNILLLLISGIIGSLQESFSIGISGALFVYYVFNFDEFKKCNKWLVFGYWIGACILVFAPGNFVKLSAGSGGTIIDLLKGRIVNIAELFYFSRMMTIMLISYIVLRFKNKHLFNSMIMQNTKYLLSILFSSLIVLIILTDTRQLFFIELFSLIVFLKILNEISFFHNKKFINLLLFSMFAYTIIMYPFIYDARKEMHKASIELQTSEVTDGYIYNNHIIKITNQLYKNIFIKRFIFPEGIDIYGLSLLKSGGTDSKYLKAVLPYQQDVLIQKFYDYNNDGIYHDKEEQFCLVRVDKNIESCNVICYSEASFMGKIRNIFFKSSEMNVRHCKLHDAYFIKGDYKYFIIYDTYMGVYKYEFTN